jgi:hypothetical protein
VVALKAELSLPSGVIGPCDCAPLVREALIWPMVLMERRSPLLFQAAARLNWNAGESACATVGIE